MPELSSATRQAINDFGSKLYNPSTGQRGVDVYERNGRLYNQATNQDLGSVNDLMSGALGGNPAINNAVGPVDKFVAPAPDVVQDTYFDQMLKSVERSYRTTNSQIDEDYNKTIADIKQNRALFDENQAKTYGQALSKVNENAYARGIGNSGIKTANITDTTDTKNFQTKSKDAQDTMAMNSADIQRKQRKEIAALGEQNSRASIKNPYASFLYS